LPNWPWKRKKLGFCDVLCGNITNNGDFKMILDESERIPSFVDILVKLITEKGFNNADVWRAACMDRRYFSKILCHRDKVPIKKTVLALGLALRLPLQEFEEFIRNAGYALSPANKFDMCVKEFVEKGEFDIIKVIDPYLKGQCLPLFANEKDEKGMSKILKRKSGRKKCPAAGDEKNKK